MFFSFKHLRCEYQPLSLKIIGFQKKLKYNFGDVWPFQILGAWIVWPMRRIQTIMIMLPVQTSSAAIAYARNMAEMMDVEVRSADSVPYLKLT